MSFGWSVGDLRAAAQLLSKVVTALKDSGGASADYEEEVTYLQSLAITLRHLDALQSSPVDRNVLLNLQTHCKAVREPVFLFLKDIQGRFQKPLGRKTSWTDVASAPRKVQWALSVSKRVTTLRRKISGNVDAIQLCLSHQTLQLVLRLPTDVKSLVAQTIDGAENRVTVYLGDIKDKAEEISVEQLKICELVREGLEGLDKSEFRRAQKLHDLSVDMKNILEDLLQSHNNSTRTILERISNDAIKIQDSQRTELQRLSNSNKESMGDLVQNLLRQEATSTTRTHSTEIHRKLEHISGFLESINTIRAELQDRPESLHASGSNITGAARALVTSLWTMWKSLDNVIKQVLIFLGVCLFTTRHVFIQPLLQSIPQRLFASTENGIYLEDLLGRQYIFPVDFFRTWEMLRCTLRFCFKGHAGEKVVNAGFYLMLDARCHDRIVDRRYWENSVQCGAKFKMSIMVEDQLQWSDPCHRCDSPLTRQGFESALNCVTCGQESCKCHAKQPLKDARALVRKVLIEDADLRHGGLRLPSHAWKSSQLPGKQSAASLAIINIQEDLKVFKRVHTVTSKEAPHNVTASQVYHTCQQHQL